MNTSQKSVARGGCLCCAVSSQVRGKARPVINSHCSQCRRFGGDFNAYTHVGDEQVFEPDIGFQGWHFP